MLADATRSAATQSRILRTQRSVGADRLERIALYERALALYPTDQKFVAEINYRLAEAFFEEKSYRLAKHRLNEAYAAAEHPSGALDDLRKRLDMLGDGGQEALPQELQDIGLPAFRRITYSIERLWRLDVAVTALPIAVFASHLGLPYWATAGHQFNLTPRSLLQNPLFNAGEYRRVLRADLRFPIDICKWRGHWLLLDGLHRLAKAELRGESSIQARQVPLKLLKSISTISTDL